MMEGEVFVISVIAIVCTTAVLKSWLKNKRKEGGIDQEVFERMARAFVKHKKDTERRIQNLEAIIADADNVKTSHRQALEIEDRERSSATASDLSNLNNMLRE